MSAYQVAEVRSVLFQFLASGVAEIVGAYGAKSEQAKIANELRDAMAKATVGIKETVQPC